MVISVCIIVTSIMAVIVALRAYVRLWLVKSCGADDWVTFLSAVSQSSPCCIFHHLTQLQAAAIVYTALAIAQTRLGLGLPLDLRPKENLEQYTVV